MAFFDYYAECNGNIAATAEKMSSQDYMDRMAAEYAQVRMRAERLHRMLQAHYAGEPDFDLKCPLPLLEAQLGILSAYASILEERERYEASEAGA